MGFDVVFAVFTGSTEARRGVDGGEGFANGGVGLREVFDGDIVAAVGAANVLSVALNGDKGFRSGGFTFVGSTDTRLPAGGEGRSGGGLGFRTSAEDVDVLEVGVFCAAVPMEAPALTGSTDTRLPGGGDGLIGGGVGFAGPVTLGTAAASTAGAGLGGGTLAVGVVVNC